MDKEQFDILVDTVLETSARPPRNLFAGGYDDWHCRARLAHFLAMPELNRPEAAKELFLSVMDVEPDEENGEDILVTIDDDEELENVYHALMDLMYEDEEEES